ncbi:hypothetical protein PG997_015159 [Apiospora hydei]|uniref:Rhodopsin domain-containing protein n=1 Tax=Apiospora hydei TaxID=1337664 RepID=A0ABR1UVW3_9PEZI
MAEKDNLLLDDPYINTTDQKRNFFDPESKVPTVIGVSVFLMALATASVAARFWTRVMILRTTGLDDWLVLLSLGLVIGHGVICCCMTDFNLGRHVGFMTEKDEFTTFMKMFYSSLVVYNAALMTIKLAFLAQYYRIMTGGGSTRRNLIIVSCVIGLWCTSQMVIVVFQCQPISGFWAPTPNTVCVPSIPGLYISAAGNIATDIMIVILPLPLIRGLHLPPAQKAVLSIVFCLGLVLLRLQYLKVSPDITWDIADSNLRHYLRLPADPQAAGRAVLPQALLDPAVAAVHAHAHARVEAARPQVDAPRRPRVRPGPAARVPLHGEPQAGAAAAERKREDADDVPATPGVRRHYEPSSRRLSSNTTKTNTTTSTPTKNNRHSSQSQPGGGYYGQGQGHGQGHNNNGHTVEIGAARSLSTRSGRKSRRSSQSDASIYVMHEITVEVEEGWERRSYYSSTL